jgi:uncharacterized cupin superfamily protein
MLIVRVYAGSDGESHLEDLTNDQFAAIINNVGDDEISLGIRAPGWSEGYHTAPRHQYVLFMEGDAEIEVASGEKRQFHPGDALVAEDVTDGIFAGVDPSDPLPPAPLRLVPFVPAGTVSGASSLAEQVIEPLWCPMVVLRQDPVRVAYANGSARSQYGLRIGEIMEYATPLGPNGLRLSASSHIECMLHRRGEASLMPARLWPPTDGGSASLLMLEPSPVCSELFEPVLDSVAGADRLLE